MKSSILFGAKTPPAFDQFIPTKNSSLINMSPTAPKLIFGTGGVQAFKPEVLSEVFSILEKHNVKDLDTARIYPDSEMTLGKAEAPKNFIIHTKAPGFRSGALAKQSVLDAMETSLKMLGVESVETLFLHSPDPSVPIEETLSAIQEIHAAGKFKHFGLSNFRPADVQIIYDIQAGAKSVLPSVFQGNYNPVSRHIESDLFPLLHKLKISFYAYSPIAGGFLVKDPEKLRAREVAGRWGPNSFTGDLYTSMYATEPMFAALTEWGHIAKDAGVTKAALAYRWIAYHSALKQSNGDGIIFGASKTAQLEETLTAIEQGPLDEKSVARIEEIWSMVEKDAPLDNYARHNL